MSNRTFKKEKCRLLVRGYDPITLIATPTDRHHNITGVCVNCGVAWFILTVENRTHFSTITHPCTECANDFPNLLIALTHDSIDPTELPTPYLNSHFLVQSHLLVSKSFPNISNYTKGVN